jgi:hypothetical protein
VRHGEAKKFCGRETEVRTERCEDGAFAVAIHRFSGDWLGVLLQKFERGRA